MLEREQDRGVGAFCGSRPTRAVQEHPSVSAWASSFSFSLLSLLEAVCMLGLCHCHLHVMVLIPAQPARPPLALPSPVGSTCLDAPIPTYAVGNHPQQIPHPRPNPIQHLGDC